MLDYIAKTYAKYDSRDFAAWIFTQNEKARELGLIFSRMTTEADANEGEAVFEAWRGEIIDGPAW